MTDDQTETTRRSVLRRVGTATGLALGGTAIVSGDSRAIWPFGDNEPTCGVVPRDRHNGRFLDWASVERRNGKQVIVVKVTRHQTTDSDRGATIEIPLTTPDGECVTVIKKTFDHVPLDMPFQLEQKEIRTDITQDVVAAKGRITSKYDRLWD